VAIATSPRLTSQALAFDVVGRNAIMQDSDYQGGRYYDHGPGPRVGLAIARMLGHITYLSREAMMEKFDADRLRPRDVATQFETKFSVGSYLAYQGDRFGERFDANSYITLSMAMDLFDMGATPRAAGALAAAGSLPLAGDQLQQRLAVSAVPVAGDRRCPAGHQSVSYCNVVSSCGHDAFLLPTTCRVTALDLGVPDEPERRVGRFRPIPDRFQGTIPPASFTIRSGWTTTSMADLIPAGPASWTWGAATAVCCRCCATEATRG
jgi:homoserine O-acetyltransferase